MCSLFGGLSSSINDNDIDYIKKLSFLACFRGIDSTGVAFAKSYGKSKGLSAVYKSMSTPPEVFKMKSYEDVIPTGFNYQAVVCHSRYATQGSVNLKNAHPFRVEHIVGMHNGTVPGLVDKSEDKTDSQVIYEKMAGEMAGNLPDLLRYIDHGAYALCWIDESKGTVNFIRNRERPLAFVDLPGNLLGWISEIEMLDFLIKRDPYIPTKTIARILPVHHHLEVKLGTTNVVIKECKPSPKVYLPSIQPKQERQPFPFLDRPKEGGITNGTVHLYPYTNKTKETTEKEEPKKVVVPTLVGPTDDMSEEKIKTLLEQGCCNCNVVVEPEKHRADKFHRRVYWLTDNTNPENSLYFCVECVRQNEMRTWGASREELKRGGIVYV